MSRLAILRAGPLATIQDEGRPGQLVHGISASGALDRSAFRLAQSLAGRACGAAVEFSSSGIGFRYEGSGCRVGLAGGAFVLSVNGQTRPWPSALALENGDVVDITTGPWGNYGYLRFDRQIDCQPIMGSRSTNVVVGLGGWQGRALRTGDMLPLVPLEQDGPVSPVAGAPLSPERLLDPVRVIWSIHADLFPPNVRAAFIETAFQVTARMDRMGVRLRDSGAIFAETKILSLTSDSVVSGDIQILGDGTPIVLLRDHQPTGGYPRIATVISADLGRFAQIRPGKTVRFQPVTLETACKALEASPS